MTTQTHDIEFIPVSDLLIDPSYQRDLRHWLLKEMQTNWHPEKVGVLTVSQRADRSYYVVDGQHRKLGAEYHGVEALICQVKRGLTHEEEAELFTGLNRDRANTTLNEILYAGLQSDDPWTRTLVNICQDSGWTLTPTRLSVPPEDHPMRAVSTLSTLARKSEDIARRTLRIIGKAWDYAPNTAQKAIISGIAMFLTRHEEIAEQEVITALRRTTVLQLLEREREIGLASRGNTRTHNLYVAILQAVNYKRPERQRIYPGGISVKKKPSRPKDSEAA